MSFTTVHSVDHPKVPVCTELDRQERVREGGEDCDFNHLGQGQGRSESLHSEVKRGCCRTCTHNAQQQQLRVQQITADMTTKATFLCNMDHGAVIWPVDVMRLQPVRKRFVHRQQARVPTRCATSRSLPV